MYICACAFREKSVPALMWSRALCVVQATLANDQMVQLWKALDDNGNGRIDAGELSEHMHIYG